MCTNRVGESIEFVVGLGFHLGILILISEREEEAWTLRSEDSRFRGAGALLVFFFLVTSLLVYLIILKCILYFWSDYPYLTK